MTFNYIKNLFPYRAKSIDEFIDIMKENQCTELITRVKGKVTVLSKEGQRYPTTYEYTSAKFKTYTSEGKIIKFTKKYKEKNSEVALKNMTYKISRVLEKMPEMKIKFIDTDGKALSHDESRGRYDILKAIVENNYI